MNLLEDLRRCMGEVLQLKSVRSCVRHSVLSASAIKHTVYVCVARRMVWYSWFRIVVQMADGKSLLVNGMA